MWKERVAPHSQTQACALHAPSSSLHFDKLTSKPACAQEHVVGLLFYILASQTMDESSGTAMCICMKDDSTTTTSPTRAMSTKKRGCCGGHACNDWRTGEQRGG